MLVCKYVLTSHNLRNHTDNTIYNNFVTVLKKNQRKVCQVKILLV